MSEPPAAQFAWHEKLDPFLRTYRTLTPFGPHGEQCRVRGLDGADGSLILTQSDQDDGVDYLHVSLAFTKRDPTYGELAAVHRAIFGRRRWAYLPFAPAVEHVNIHSHALHLFGRVDGARVLPDFTRGSGSI